MKKPSICFLVFNSKNNGGNRVIFELGNRLSKKGYEIEFTLIFGEKPKWLSLNKNVKFTGVKQMFSTRDILVATFWPTAYMSFLLSARKKYYFVQGWEMDFYKNYIFKTAVRLSFSFKFTVITTSIYLENNLKRINSQLKIYNTRGVGIDPVFFESKRKIIQKNKKITRILSVISTYAYPKGVDQLVDVINNLKKKSNNYKFILISSETNPYNNIFDEFISNASSKNMANVYKNADIFLSTSRSEGFSLSIVESMASGCPVITTDSGGINEYARNYKNCIIVEKINEIWGKNLIEKVIENKIFYCQLSRNGYNTAKTYNWDNIVPKIEKIFLKS